LPELPLNDAGHLPPEAMYGYENRLLTASELRVVHDHIAACGDCRARLAGRLRADEAAADARVRALRAAHARVEGDSRLALLQSLRRAGMPLAAALVEVERRSRDCGR